MYDVLFGSVHKRCLIYNTCWEDPRIDRQLLQLNRQSRVVMITSAGCNALDYLLDAPAEIHAVDVNPRQNALLQLKTALIARGDFEDLFSMFGRGSHQAYKDVYRPLRELLTASARDFWDQKIHYFDQHTFKHSFYYHGTSGNLAWLLTHYLKRAQKNLSLFIHALLEAHNLEEQKECYQRIESELWTTFSQWLVKQPLFMIMLGVSKTQVQLIQTQYSGGILAYIREKLAHVFTRVLMKENYFWRVYLTGSYTPTCCPNYLKPEYFERLQANIQRITTYTATLTHFLKNRPATYTHFVLLDHQDWLVKHHFALLEEEWEHILRCSTAGTKILMRSASPQLDFLPTRVHTAVRFFPGLTGPLHLQDRVGTYGSLHLAEVR